MSPTALSPHAPHRYSSEHTPCSHALIPCMHPPRLQTYHWTDMSLVELGPFAHLSFEHTGSAMFRRTLNYYFIIQWPRAIPIHTARQFTLYTLLDRCIETLRSPLPGVVYVSFVPPCVPDFIPALLLSSFTYTSPLRLRPHETAHHINKGWSDRCVTRTCSKHQ